MLETLGTPNSSLGVPGGQPALTCLGIWSLKCCHTSTCSGIHQSRDPRRSSCLNLPRGPILRRPNCLDLPRKLSCLSLPGDLHPDPGMPGCQVATVLGRISLKKTHPKGSPTMEIEEGLLVFIFIFLPVRTVFQMENNQSTFQQMPLRCILDNWKLFHPLTLRRNHLKFFCVTVWPHYPLGDKEHWPEDGSLNYNTILQLEFFCKRQGKWTEIPYVQIFF